MAPVPLTNPNHAEGAPGPSQLGTGDGGILASAPTTQPSGISAYFAGVQPSWVYDAFGNRKSEAWDGTGTASVPTSSTSPFPGIPSRAK